VCVFSHWSPQALAGETCDYSQLITHLTDDQEQNALEEFPSQLNVKFTSDGHVRLQTRSNHGTQMLFCPTESSVSSNCTVFCGCGGLWKGPSPSGTVP